MPKLVDIGMFPSFDGNIRYYKCPKCHSRYPCMAGMDPRGRPLRRLQHTLGPMCNGRPITHCPCEPQT